MYDLVESGKRLKELRFRTGKTQIQVAEELGISLDTVKKNEQGFRGLSVDQADMYADYYESSIDYIVNGNEKCTGKLEKLLAEYPDEMQVMALKILKGILDNLQ